MIKKLCVAVAVLACISVPAKSDVRLHGLFTDNMVIQRATEAPVWGWADPGETVTVTASWGDKSTTTAATDGSWMVKLATPWSNGGAHTITVAGKNTITLHNVLCGDVWVCAGQSNMDRDLNAFARQGSYPPESVKLYSKLINGKYPRIRSILIAKQYRAEPQKDIVIDKTFHNSWQTCDTPEILGVTTAVGFLFAKRLSSEINAPIGLIDSNKGGTRVELWTDAKTLGMTGKITEKNGVASSKNDSVLYNGMIAPLMPFAIKGVIWYQGESNSKSFDQAIAYSDNFAKMIRCWRRNWGQGAFPFLFVQLAAFHPAAQEPAAPNDIWPYTRESQTKTLALPNTGMASAIDVGMQKNIHPWRKAIVGDRLAAAARKIAYGTDIVYTGPTFDGMQVEGRKAVISFKNIGSGLVAKDCDLDGIKVSSSELKGFVICGDDRKFVWADAVIKGDTVVVSSPDVKKPVAVRYAWADFPVCNLYNKEGFPANPFRTDNFPAPKK